VSAALPPEWPPCGAPCTDKRAGAVCRAAGDGYGGRCRWHGGLDLPASAEPWCVYYTRGGIYIGRGKPEERVSWRSAALLVEAGRVARGVFFRKSGQSLLARLAASRVGARLVTRHKFVREYAFEVQP
jgi:hypothetical protein